MKNITPGLKEAYIAQTQKYFDPKTMDTECLICPAVPSYQSMQDDKERCSDCPIGVPGEDGSNYVTCVDHPTYMQEYERVFRDEGHSCYRENYMDQTKRRGEYLIEMGEKAGIDMSSVRKEE